MLPSFESAAALSQLLAVLLLATAFSRARRLQRVPRPSDGSAWLRLFAVLADARHWRQLKSVWVLLSHLLAAVALFALAIVVAAGGHSSVLLLHLGGVILTLLSLPGLMLALLDDIADHAARDLSER